MVDVHSDVKLVDNVVFSKLTLVIKAGWQFRRGLFYLHATFDFYLFINCIIFSTVHKTNESYEFTELSRKFYSNFLEDDCVPPIVLIFIRSCIIKSIV